MNLQDAANKRVEKYSLGMKQRLGLALALLHEPELLILDEPTNGLDPSGIREIRELIRQLPQLFGATVFVSSHLLDEVEKMADHVAVMHQGQLRFQGRLSELRHRSVLELRALNGSVLTSVLSQLEYPYQYNAVEELWSIPNMCNEKTAQLSAQLINAGVALTHLHLRQSALETLFFSITEAGSQREGAFHV